MLRVPTIVAPSQLLTATLGNQVCQIVLRQTDFGLFCDLYVNNSPIILSVICENLNRIVRSVYLCFVGDLMFLDTQGEDDPDFAGLGSRFILIYLEAADLPAGTG